MENILYLDMDGVLSQFYKDPDFLKKMYEKGYFIQLEPYRNLTDALKKMIKNGVKIRIVSAVLTDNEMVEKTVWLERVFDNLLPAADITFVRAGCNKALGVIDKYGKRLNAHDFLLDDFNANLRTWEDFGGTSIKFCNEINDKGTNGPKWVGYRILHTDNAEVITQNLHRIFLDAGN